MSESTPEIVGAELYSCDPEVETLHHKHPDDVIEEHLDGMESLPEVVTLYGFAKVEIGERRRQAEAENALVLLLESLDEDFGDPEGGTWTQMRAGTMTAAARAFVDAVLTEYPVWRCEGAGNPIEVNVAEWVVEHRPDWLEGKEG